MGDLGRGCPRCGRHRRAVSCVSSERPSDLKVTEMPLLQNSGLYLLLPGRPGGVTETLSHRWQPQAIFT